MPYLAAHAEGLIGVLLADATHLEAHRAVFGRRAYLALSPRRLPGDALRLHALAEAARAAQVGLLATGDVLYHTPERRILQDIVTCIREHTTIDAAGFTPVLIAADDTRPMPTADIYIDPIVPPETSNSNAPRLLIVDDDAAQRSLLDSFLSSQGFDTVPVSSGQRALEVLREQKINMMISDVRMPGLTGLETLRLARQEHGSFPILLVTAYADVRDAVGAIRDGAVNYLSKPIDLDELLASVRFLATFPSSPPPKAAC